MKSDAATSLNRLLDSWRTQPSVAENIVGWHTEPPRAAQWEPLPERLPSPLITALSRLGIDRLYGHQRVAWEQARAGQDVVIVTATASGKTLCYNLPVLATLLEAANATALYLFPTKALTQDQHTLLEKMTGDIGTPNTRIAPAVYDGDTPANKRVGIRNRARLVLTNPDMLHTAILPHHTQWQNFLSNLRFVVIDEIHVYRGVFGSHLANVLRRLRRVANFYGASLQHIMTSATIANPRQHAERLAEKSVVVIDQDGSPGGERHFLLYNPPIVQAELGIRRSAISESLRLIDDLIIHDVQSLVFARARRTVELMLKDLLSRWQERRERIRGYRSGYLPVERRRIEAGLRQAKICTVITTNALELGIDIGGVDAILLVGYPGSIAATRQQAGRAGRRENASLAVFVASGGPLDQYLVRHPEFLLEKSPEQALINPDNLLILLKHLQCAAFELPFSKGEGFGSTSAPVVEEILSLLEGTGEIHQGNGRFFWSADVYPAAQVSLRSISAQPVLLQAQVEDSFVTIGSVDRESACWMVHPGAIYLHEGSSFVVETLDLENRRAELTLTDVDYFTEARQRVDAECLQILSRQEERMGTRVFGEIRVTTQVTGYRRLRWLTQENMGEFPLELPATNMRTIAYWISLSSAGLEQLRQTGSWCGESVSYGKNWTRQKELTRRRDEYTCQVCGRKEVKQAHHVHHKLPFRTFDDYEQANQLENLVTLCPSCHQRAEMTVRMRSGLAGLGYLLHHLAPLLVMCDPNDLGVWSEPQSALGGATPTVVLYDNYPGGVGLSESLYHAHERLLNQAKELAQNCTCMDGCPACTGPAGELGSGGRQETLAILNLLCSEFAA